MTKDRIKIGRGAADTWVDLRLHTKQDISREHVQVRLDTASGKFFIKDLSTYGTSVDGKKLRVRLSPHSYTMVKVKVG